MSNVSTPALRAAYLAALSALLPHVVLYGTPQFGLEAFDSQVDCAVALAKSAGMSESDWGGLSDWASAVFHGAPASEVHSDYLALVQSAVYFQ